MGSQEPSKPDLEAALVARGPAGYWRTVADALETKRRKGPARPVGLAMTYAHIGDRQRALSWLQQAVEERDPWVVHQSGTCFRLPPQGCPLSTDRSSCGNSVT